MSIEETLDWMCKYMTYWYVKTGKTKEVIYPITKNKQRIVRKILNEKADLMIYDKSFYTIERDIDKTINKTSYLYFLKKATPYKRKKGKLVLPYDLKDKDNMIISKLLTYYKENDIPFYMITVSDLKDVRNILSNCLNPFSYINISLRKILVHRDVYTRFNDKLLILITAENEKKLQKKYTKIEKEIENLEDCNFNIIDNFENDNTDIKEFLTA